MKKVTVIGSGISGLSISKLLSRKYDVEILEKGDKVGGLIKCDRVEGNLFHRVGGHVFNSTNKTVLEWFWNHFDREQEFLQTKRNAKIFLNNKFIGYPLENYLYQLPEDDVRSILEELIELSSKVNGDLGTYTNFKDFLIGNFGTRLYELYFGPYNSKIWNTDISDVPLEWLEGKLPMPKIKEVIISNVIKKEESAMVHASFYYPVRNGSQFIVDRLAEDQQIKVSYEVKKISATEQGKLSVNHEDLITDTIIYCGDVRQLHSIIDIEDDELKDALSSVSSLRSNGTSNVLCETNNTEISWLYLPESKFKAHRIIYTGNFSSTNNEGSRKTCVVEFSGRQDKDEMIKELENLPGDLKPIAFNYEPNSYIIQDKDTRSRIKELKGHLAKYNIFLLGRFAEWEYYNMDKCIEAAMELSEQI